MIASDEGANVSKIWLFLSRSPQEGTFLFLFFLPALSGDSEFFSLALPAMLFHFQHWPVLATEFVNPFTEIPRNERRTIGLFLNGTGNDSGISHGNFREKPSRVYLLLINISAIFQ